MLKEKKNNVQSSLKTDIRKTYEQFSVENTIHFLKTIHNMSKLSPIYENDYGKESLYNPIFNATFSVLGTSVIVMASPIRSPIKVNGRTPSPQLNENEEWIFV